MASKNMAISENKEYLKSFMCTYTHVSPNLELKLNLSYIQSKIKTLK